MNISILTTTIDHPVYDDLRAWAEHRSDHAVTVETDPGAVGSGDILFLISCKHLIGADVRDRFAATLVIHASDLPEGRGWSPHVWQILAGAGSIVVSMIEAEDRVDTGRIWAQRTLEFEGHELYDEINEALFDAELSLMDQAVDDFDTIAPRDQIGQPSEPYPARTPADSELDVDRSLADQFDLLRVADPHRFPAFFHHRGHRYTVRIEKSGD